MHYNGSNSFLFVNPTKIYQFKAKKKDTFCLGNISGNFPANNMEKTRLNECVYDFSVDYRALDTSNIINSHKCFMKKYDIK